MKYFYENEKNEQIGPIDIEKLKSIKIKSSTLIWKEGTENWNEAKNFDELKDLFIIPPPLPKKNNEFKNSTTEIKTIKHNIFSYKGRMRRSKYLGFTLILWLPLKGITYLIENYFYEEVSIEVLKIFILILLIPILYLYTMISIKRVHDIGSNGWFFITSFIPVANLILIFCDGTEGPNKYGPDPKNR